MLGMNNKKMSTIIMSRIKPSGSTMDKPAFAQKIGEPGPDAGMSMPEDDNDSSDTGLEAAMEDFISALHSKDAGSAAKCFKELFDIADAMPDSDDSEDEATPPTPGSVDIKALVSKKLGK